VSDADGLGGGVARRLRGSGVLLRALDGDLQGGTTALRRRLFAVICLVVVCELLVILAVSADHEAGARASARSADAAARTDAASRPAVAGRPGP
jgi:hypothetical protein